MSNKEIIFEVGQVWACKRNYGMTYEVYEIDLSSNGQSIIWTHNYTDGVPEWDGHFISDSNCSASGLNDDWYVVKNAKTFSRIRFRTLRKRERDQMAAQALTHRLTE